MRRDVFQAIADPTRREIMTRIASQNLTPNALAESFTVSRQAISKHIRILTECGLITIRQQGRERICSVQPDKLHEVTDWLSGFTTAWEQRFTALDNLLKQQQDDEQTNESNG